MGYMAQVEENQSSPSDSRTRSQSEEQSLEREISQPRLLFRIKVPHTAYQKTPIQHWDSPSSSSSSDSETEMREYDDLSSYLPRWPVTGRRGRCSIVGMRENQEIEGKKSVSEIGKRLYPESKVTKSESNSVKAKISKRETEGKKFVSESGQIGKRVYPENKLKIDESNSVKAKILKRETEGKKSVIESGQIGKKFHHENKLTTGEKQEKSISKPEQIGNRVYTENKLTIGESNTVKTKNLKQEKSVSESSQIRNRVYPENKLTICESNCVKVKAKNLKQKIEDKKFVSESGHTGKRNYPENKLTIGKSNSVKAKNLSRKRKQRAVIESDDEFGNAGEKPLMGNKHHKKEKHDYIQERDIHTEHERNSNSSGKSFSTSPDLTARWHCNDPEEASRRPEISSSTDPKVLAFDLNDFPPMDQEEDVVE